MLVSSIDWSQQNKIVTCSHDRNAFVWNLQPDGHWKPSLVILRINRAALHVRWSPDGQKFAVTSGAKCVPVCRFEADNDWWISKMIKQHRSTVLCVAWHPNSQLIATGSTDFKCRVFCTYIPQVDVGGQDSGPAQFEEVDFGEKLAEFDCKGWIEAVAWSPSGNRLAFAGHNSTTTIVSVSESMHAWREREMNMNREEGGGRERRAPWFDSIRFDSIRFFFQLEKSSFTHTHIHTHNSHPSLAPSLPLLSSPMTPTRSRCCR